MACCSARKKTARERKRPRLLRARPLAPVRVMNASSSYWPTRLVVVVASLRGRYPGMRASHRSLAFRPNTSTFTFVVYQRLDPTAPNFCPNHAHEAGVYIQFILDHYDHLPHHTVFVQDHFADHNPDMLGWASCVKPVRIRPASLCPTLRARIVVPRPLPGRRRTLHQ